MPKRKAKELGVGEEPRRSGRRIFNVKDDVLGEDDVVTPTSKSVTKKKGGKAKESIAVNKEELEEEGPSELKNAEKPKAKPASAKTASAKIASTKPATTNGGSQHLTGRQYWLMKAEPESRIEKGKDIKFSIDDLASKTQPEPWDGIRAYAARNNLRAMNKGDLAFFYHSSCKIPAIVGIMEIVQEHTPDLSAHDPDAPYYDPKSKPEDPKWSVVHVEFRQKLQTPITLKELKVWQAEKGHPLAEMQMLKLGRMSVSKVCTGEWEFLVGEMEKRSDEVKL